MSRRVRSVSELGDWKTDATDVTIGCTGVSHVILRNGIGSLPCKCNSGSPVAAALECSM